MTHLSKLWAEDLDFFVKDATGRLIINEETREWCKLPYSGYSDGCPFYGKRPDCPPAAPLINEYLDLNCPHFLAFQKFDLEGFAQRMQKKHPEWSEKQTRCSRYWQGHVRSILKMNIEQIITSHQETILIPEAMGVDVFKSAKNLGIILEIRPKKIIYKVALIGIPRERFYHYRNIPLTSISDVIFLLLQKHKEIYLDDLKQLLFYLCQKLSITFTAIDFYDEIGVLTSEDFIRIEANIVYLSEEGKIIAKKLEESFLKEYLKRKHVDRALLSELTHQTTLQGGIDE